MSKHPWEEPRIVNADAYADGLGDCVDGGTATDFTCANGRSTGATGGTLHRCANGGYAGADYGGCALGKSPDGDEE